MAPITMMGAAYAGIRVIEFGSVIIMTIATSRCFGCIAVELSGLASRILRRWKHYPKGPRAYNVLSD
jgi:hypothetical protein